MMWPGMECGALSACANPGNPFSAHSRLPWVSQEYVSLAEVLQLCFRLDPHASAIPPNTHTWPLPNSEVSATACVYLPLPRGLLVCALGLSLDGRDRWQGLRQ